MLWSTPCIRSMTASGSEAYVTKVLAPLNASFDNLHRRDDIVMAGNVNGDSWISATGYYAGHFVRDWIGITAPERLCFLRVWRVSSNGGWPRSRKLCLP